MDSSDSDTDTTPITDIPTRAGIRMAHCTACDRTVKAKNKKSHVNSFHHKMKIAEIKEFEQANLKSVVPPDDKKLVVPVQKLETSAGTSSTLVPANQSTPIAANQGRILIVAVNTAVEAAQILKML